ncbi:MAG TPA: serine/threonine-protein kinase [Crinalium sp.]|jgi:WD40 repeat protein
MTYCLNPACWQPQNPDDATVCQNCGAPLLLGDRYRPLKVLGQGGFGKTFLAIDEREQDQPFCVIKQSLPRAIGDVSPRKTVELFRQEAERLAELGQHPQISQLLDHFEQDNAQYLVQEFINGPNLATLLAQDGPFTEAHIHRLLNDLLPVLAFIHSHQVIHRDIKPENIVCPAGMSVWERGHARLVLVDFGASKYATGPALARTGTIIGSAGYVAPEQAMGKAEFASDIYSLGVTCIHLLTDLHPFDLYSVSEDAWVWRQYLIEPIGAQLANVLDRMLTKATSQRYRTATAVLQDLNRLPSLSSAANRQSRSTSRSPNSTLPSRSSANPSPAARREASWQEMGSLLGHSGPVTAIAISPDSRLIASGSRDKTIKLWNLITGELLHSFAGRSLLFSAGHSDCIRSLVFSPDGRTLISASDDGTVKRWDLANLKLFSTLPEHGWGISAIAISPDGFLLASGGGDGRIYLWDLETEELIDSLAKHRDQISALIISDDGQQLLSASYDKTVRLWDLESSQLLNSFRGHVARVSDIAVTSDWLTLVSSSWDKTLKIWDLEQGKQLQTLMAHRDPVSCVAISPNDQFLASGSEDSTIRVWPLQQGDRLELPQNQRPLVLRHSWSVNTLCFSPDSRFLVSGSADETIKIWQRS